MSNISENNHLIAAELLEALRRMVTEFQFVERDEITEKVYLQALDAIAKAEGRQ